MKKLLSSLVALIALLGGQTLRADCANGVCSSAVISQIHNAPGWLPSRSYTAGSGPYTRVVSGPGWNPGTGTFTAGQPLRAYQLTSAGSCTSASGGGPTGFGAAISDGTCTWKYLSSVDYVTITGFLWDNNPWSAQAYGAYSVVVSDMAPRAYVLTDSSGCVSTVAPTGNTGTADATVPGIALVPGADGCHWDYVAEITYSSRAHHIPTQVFATTTSATVQMDAHHWGMLWNDREYVADLNGEMRTIISQFHNDYHNDSVQNSLDATCPGQCYQIILAPAKGEGFSDSLASSSPLAGYDATKGVAIRNPNIGVYPLNDAAALMSADNYMVVVGLQLQSVHGAGFDGIAPANANHAILRNDILEGGNEGDPFSTHAAVSVDVSSVVSNCLIISHAQAGVYFKYAGTLLNSTIVDTSGIANSVAVAVGANWAYPGQTVHNVAAFGFSHFVATGDNPPTSTHWLGSHNITDAPAGDSGPVTYTGSLPPMTVVTMPGSTYGASASSSFVNPGSDWRPAGALLNGGVRYGSFAVNCNTVNPNCPWKTTYNFDSSNIVNAARPPYNIGAW